MQISKKATLPLAVVRWTAAALFLAALVFSGQWAKASTNQPVIRLMAKMPLQLYGNPRWRSLVEAATRETSPGALMPTNAEIIAWSVKTDNLGVPPRLFEDSILLINVLGPAHFNAWLLAYMCRMTSGGLKGAEWALPAYPPLCKPPIATFRKFQQRPSDREIADFVHASDFGYNSFDPDFRALEVAVFAGSEEVEAAVRGDVSTAEKARRRFLHQQCLLERVAK